MSNFTKSLGNFQANVGIFSADIGVIMSYIIAGILIITSIILAVFAFIPMNPQNCDDLDTLKQDKLFNCDKTKISYDNSKCNNATDTYNDEKNRCSKKVKNTWLLFFLLLIPLAIFIIFFSKWWKNYVHHNKTAAQVGGTLFELNTLKNLINN